MVRFLNLIAAEPDIARVPVMIDSSKWAVIEAGLKCLQGKGIVNSISLKEGEAAFLEQARTRAPLRRRRRRDGLRRAGPGRHGRAQGRDLRARYRLLTETVGFPPEDIIFDPNIFAVATGIEEHDNYARRLHRGDARRSSATCPHAQISGGVSNVSFSFRGNDPVREAMHSVFLYHAIRAGMDMGIVNAGQLAIYEEIAPELRERVEDVILNRRAGRDRAPARDRRALQGRRRGTKRAEDLAWRGWPVEQAARARAGQGHRRVHRRGHRGGAAGSRAPAAT